MDRSSNRSTNGAGSSMELWFSKACTFCVPWLIDWLVRTGKPKRSFETSVFSIALVLSTIIRGTVAVLVSWSLEYSPLSCNVVLCWVRNGTNSVFEANCLLTIFWVAPRWIFKVMYLLKILGFIWLSVSLSSTFLHSGWSSYIAWNSYFFFSLFILFYSNVVSYFSRGKRQWASCFFLYFMWFSSPWKSLWIIGGYQDIRRGITPRVPPSLSDTDSCQASGFAPLHLEVTWKFWRDDTTKNKGVKSSRVLVLFFTTSCCRNKF